MHEYYLKQALALAEIRRGFCAPNPAVGAVIVKNNAILATGHHWASGCSHAEVVAINAFNERPSLTNSASLAGATLYVTLEPCCHYGKTPPCTDLISQSGIKRVVYGMRDPNPAVANKSAMILQQAGIESIYLPLPEIQIFYKSYAYWWQHKKPYLTAKIALSLDGKIAGANGQRVNITGNSAKQFTHQQRKRSDALLTTAKTLICDDPLLNVRLENETLAKTIYILDSHLTTPLNTKIFTSAAKVIFFHDKTVTEKVSQYLNKGATCISINSTHEGLDLVEIINYLGENGLHDVWIEAGGHCFTAFIQANLIQRALIYIAPKYLGTTAQSAFHTQHNLLKHAKAFAWQPMGEDVVCEISF